LVHYGIQTPLISLHAHNEKQRSQEIIQKLQEGNDVGFITDAGTPLISDPGAHFIRLVRQAGFNIIPIPGPSAVITALCVSGLYADRFLFEGFLPTKKGEREKRLSKLKELTCTIVFYEAPHRILTTVSAMKKIFGPQRYGVIARELTKKFETVYGNNLDTLLDWLATNPQQQKGEFVIMLEGAPKTNELDKDYIEELLKNLLTEVTIKKAVTIAAKITGETKNRLYKMALTLKKLV
jgi:16S rRNA (cytidine1402-2'-O)-methyltransferase